MVTELDTDLTGTQNDIFIRKVFFPGAVSDRNASSMLTRVGRVSVSARSCCHTTYSVEPVRHSQRSTTLLLNERVLKSRLRRLKVLPPTFTTWLPSGFTVSTVPLVP